MMEYLPPAEVEWLAQELMDVIVKVACTQHGCRIVQLFRTKPLAFFGRVVALNKKIMDNIKALMLSENGKWVVEDLLTNHPDEHAKVLDTLHANLGPIVESRSGRAVSKTAVDLRSASSQ